MLVTVTGASGHVGAALVRELLARGHAVRALVRTDTRPMEGLPVELRKVDVRDRAAVDAAVAGSELVFHAAAQVALGSGADPGVEATNVEGTRNVVEASRRAGVRRLVHFSSAHALKKDGSALLEGGEGRTYEASKAVAERLVLDATKDLDAVIVSPCAVLGPHDFKPSYIGRVLVMFARGLVPVAMVGGQSWVDVRDIARSTIAAAERGERGARYVLGGHWLPFAELLTIAGRELGVRPPLFSLPVSVGRALAPLGERVERALGRDPLFTPASVEALEHVARPLDPEASRVLDHRPRPLEETVRDVYAFFRERGLVKSSKGKS